MKTLYFQSLSLLLSLALVSTVHASNGHGQGVGKTPETLFVVASGVDLEIDERRPEVVSMTAIHLRTDLLVEGAQSESGLFQFALPDGGKHELHFEAAGQSATGSWIWSGVLKEAVKSYFAIAIHGESAVGKLEIDDKLYMIEPVRPEQGLHRLVEINPFKFEPCGVKEEEQVVSRESTSLSNTASEATYLADVLVAYLPGVANQLSGHDGVIALADLSVWYANTAYVNSAIPLQIRLVGVQETLQGGNMNQQEMLDRIETVNDGWYDEIPPLRDSVGADFVALFVTGGVNCGLANLMTSPGPGFASQAYSVTKWSCAVANLTFSHELGHNMGCKHDRQNAAGNWGAYPFSYGYRTSSGGGYRTVMAYSPGTRINYFSNPEVSYNGVVLGVADPSPDSADNSRSIGLTAPIFSQFRCGWPEPFGDSMVTSQWAELELDWTGTPNADGTGGFNVFVRNGVPNQFGILFYGSNSAAVPFMGGNRYVGFPLTRMPVVQVSAGGMAFFDWIGHAQPVPGVAQFLQFWQRDPNNISGFSVAMSNGVRVDPCN